MMESPLHKEQFQGPLKKLVHMYLPSSNNPKFANKLLISKMSTPHTMNICFTQNKSPSCLHSKDNARDHRFKMNKDGLRISIKQEERTLTGIDLILSARYNKDKQIDNQQKIHSPTTLRESTKRQIHDRTIVDRWRSINFAIKQRQKQKERQHRMRSTIGSRDVEKQVRTSISRMLQQTKDKETFQYITKFYKKPIERQIAVRKVRRESKNFSEILNVCEFKPRLHRKSRNNKTIQPRCRCHKSSLIRETTRINNTSYLSKRAKQVQTISQEKKPQTSTPGHRKILTLNLPENWVVDSWQTQSKNLQEGASLSSQKCQFHD